MSVHWQPSDVIAHEQRLKAMGVVGKVSALDNAPPDGADVERESKLHREIIAWCDDQWPRVKFIRGRMDKRSTIAKGAHDFTIFLPGGKTVCVECKKKDTKPDENQAVWACELRHLGHTVHVVRSMAEFHAVLKEAK